MKRLYRIGLTMVLALFFLTGVVFAEGEWILTGKGYKVWNPSPKDVDNATWTGGADAEGYASGKGVLQWFQEGKPGAKYEGDFLKGKAHGKGVYTYTNGNRYEGDYVDNMRNGKGVYTYADGDRYEGDYVNNQRNGKGVYTHANGERYEGDFANGNFNGKGVYTFVDGARYVGNWVNNERNGNGTMYAANGEILQQGRWKDNMFIGP